jgi:hypothetical protein
MDDLVDGLFLSEAVYEQIDVTAASDLPIRGYQVRGYWARLDMNDNNELIVSLKLALNSWLLEYLNVVSPRQKGQKGRGTGCHHIVPV